MDRLKGVEYFKRIYELGSFTAAADEFRCSNAVISKYVKFLESWTGAKLILRNTRTISFTDEGHRFYEYCRSITEQTEHLLDSVANTGELAGQLVIASPVSLTMKVLAPLVFQFQNEHPQIAIRMQMSDQITDPVGSGVDLAIRGIEAPEDSSLIAVRLGALERILVVSPSYLNRVGAPETVGALDQHQCLIYSLSSDANRWEFSLSTGDTVPISVPVSGPVTADNSLVLADAAKAGLGIALVPRAYVQQELVRGELRELHLDARPIPRSIYAVYSDRKYLPKRARLFTEFLKAAFR
ncbi:MAG: LysR family transcriptional regulator [Marinobacter sp.]|nr:LysR family transcriptional regulator [Marinobacter sp.]